ncbi:MAG: SUMF1/EgtB/PvdO family nonheme iron enzyme [Anaerolineales bacterium]|nr:SUMF1/EgtB/PvdO family nonheme iron enzyme [Anaerolineales bacterium]
MTLTLVVLILSACTIQTPTPSLKTHTVMMEVPAGWFWMGENDDRRSNRPKRKVYLDAFAIDKTEVTNAAFASFIASTGHEAEGWNGLIAQNNVELPVMGVLWKDADAYCRWAGKRLPTEAEWEKAARGTDGRRFPWGDTWKQVLANTSEAGLGAPVPVGSYPDGASPYGVLDMAGNASEWVADHYDPDYYSHAPDRNPLGPTQILDHVLRGGSWASPMEQAQTFYRNSSHSVRPNPRVGFRCAMDVTESLPAN